MSDCYSFPYKAEVFMNKNFSNGKDTSEVATGFWLQAGVLLLLSKCHKVAVRVRPTRLPVTCNPTCPEETLKFTWI